MKSRLRLGIGAHFFSIGDRIASMKSENWGGMASIIGSSIVALGGDRESLASTVAFWAAEGMLTFFGHRSVGYSVGCFFFGAGDIALCFSAATAGNYALRITMASIAATWLLGSLRYPAELAASGFRDRIPVVSRGFARVAQSIQPVVGGLALVQRLPALATSAFDGKVLMPSPVMFVATFFWAVSDVLCGRLQYYVNNLYNMLNKRSP